MVLPPKHSMYYIAQALLSLLCGFSPLHSLRSAKGVFCEFNHKCTVQVLITVVVLLILPLAITGGDLLLNSAPMCKIQVFVDADSNCLVYFRYGISSRLSSLISKKKDDLPSSQTSKPWAISPNWRHRYIEYSLQRKEIFIKAIFLLTNMINILLHKYN